MSVAFRVHLPLESNLCIYSVGLTVPMLTKLTIRNFKRFGEVEIELGSPVVFIGPNNSGQDLGHAGAGALGYRPQCDGMRSVPARPYTGKASRSDH